MGEEQAIQTLIPTLVPGLMLLAAMVYSVLIAKRFLQVVLDDPLTPNDESAPPSR